MMEENILHIGGNTIIFNGGNPLPGCPESWEEAYALEKKFNEDKNWERETDDFKEQPVWSFDCGFKLDFDGPLIDMSSRFYPPKSHYGSTWDGTASVRLMGKDVAKKKFDCPTIEELKTQVEAWRDEIIAKIKASLTQ